MKETLFSIGDFDISYNDLVGLGLIIIFGWFLYGFLTKWLVPRLAKGREIEKESMVNIRSLTLFFVVLICSLIALAFLNLDHVLVSSSDFDLKISLFIQGLIVIQLARILDWMTTNLFIHDYYVKRDVQKQEVSTQRGSQVNRVNRLVTYIFFILAIIFLLNIFNMDISLFENSFNGEEFNLRISSIFLAILIFFVAQLFVWVITQLLLYNIYKRREVELGAQYAINQLFKYIVYVIAIIMMFDQLGLNITILLGGAAALLVGIGLGLQQTFNDFISGLVLLFERTVSVGDVLEVGGIVGNVKKIGLRASIIETRGNITILVPNSKLVNENVTNWTHFDDKVRFKLDISVAYGTDTKLVKNILIGVAKANPYIIDFPAPFVRFEAFGESSLDFTLYFFSRNFIVIEDIKSDLRFDIDLKFRESNIVIPFPTRTVWSKSD